MDGPPPESLAIIAGNGVYPRLLAESARAQGVKRLFALAFRRETDRRILDHVDDAAWVRVGQVRRSLDALSAAGIPRAVMAGQIAPRHLFSARLDRDAVRLLGQLRERNAESVFGLIGRLLAEQGIELLPASLFMEAHMPAPGLLGRRRPDEREREDVRLGFRVAKATSALDIGQTVVVKAGTILAVEAFEGTDRTIRRAGKVGGAGAVVVKVAKPGHDMRFDIPCVGETTLKRLRRAKASVLAVEAGRTILLDRAALVEQADRQGLCLLAMGTESDADHLEET